MMALALSPLPKTTRPADTVIDLRWRDLLHEIARGNQQALAEFYDVSHRLVFGLALRILRDHGAAEEVTLDVYMLIWKQAATFDVSRGRPLTWLLTIARHRAIDRTRAAGWSRRHATPIEDILPVIASDDSPERDMTMTETRRRVRAALAQLKPEQRQLIEIAYYEGFTQQELAAYFDVPLGTIKTRIRTGMLRLRELLDEH